MAATEPLDIKEDMVFKLSHKRSPSDVKLRSLEWAIVTQLNGEKTVAQIGEILALSPEETQAMFTRLRDEGLLVLVGTPEKDSRVPLEVFDHILFRLTYYLGPVASVIMEDVLADLKRKRENLERRQLAILVELLSLEISNPDNRYEFQKEMLKKIKGLI